MVRHPEYKFLKEVTEKQNKMYEKILASKGQEKSRERRKPILVVGLVPCDPHSIGKFFQNTPPAFQKRFRRPPVPAPSCPKCKFERNGNFDSHDPDEICEHCNKMVTYRSFRVCDCGCRPTSLGQRMPAFMARMMDHGDQGFNTSDAKQPKVGGNPEPLYFVTHHDEE